MQGRVRNSGNVGVRATGRQPDSGHAPGSALILQAGGRMARTFLALLVGLSLLLVVNRWRGTDQSLAEPGIETAIQPAVAAPGQPASASAGPTTVSPQVEQSAAQLATPPSPGETPSRPPEADTGDGGRTPVIERMARLEARRQVFRFARFTYIDSMLTGSDSLIRRWPDRAEGSLRVSLDVPSELSTCAARCRRALETALDRWRGLGIGLSFRVVDDSTQADIAVHWIEKFDLDRSGQADVQWSHDGTIRFARVTLAVQADDGRPLSDRELAIVATHEVGHALGLPHSGRTTDVMFPTARVDGISDRDRATITLLYSIPPGSLRDDGALRGVDVR